MNFDAAIGLGLVFFFVQHGSDGYQEDLWYQNNPSEGCTGAGGSRRWVGRNFSVSGSDEDLGQYYERVPSGAPAADFRPLILSPYVRTRRYQEGIKAAKVTTAASPIESYSGFFELDKRQTSYMFFWYFHPLSKEYVGKPETPVIIWIQGEMGKSAMSAAFRENGPVRMEPNQKLTLNKWSWADRAHLVYFDSPVGTGYSFTKTGKYPTTQHKVATDLYTALGQFLVLFRLMTNPLFIIGQEYAGKTVAALGAMIHRKKKALKINLKGVAIGNGFVDPPNMLEYGKFLYQLGFIDEETRDELHLVHDAIQDSLKQNMETEAMDLYTEYIQRNLKNRATFMDKKTALVSIHNFTQVRKGVDEDKLLGEFLNKDSTRRALHATGTPFAKKNVDVIRAIWPDLLKSQVHNLKLVMNNYRVLLYHGQMSIRNAYPLVLEYLSKISWRDRRNYNRAERVQWTVDGETAGYFKTGGLFTELLMRNAGCRVSADQPKWAQRMINKFIFNEDFNSE